MSRVIVPPEMSALGVADYERFLLEATEAFARTGFYFAPDEGREAVELAHMIPEVPETLIAIYVSLNDAVCQKGLVTPFLLNHAHNPVLAFDPALYGGKEDVPTGTCDARGLLNGFEPPNASWPTDWTYVMIEDPARSIESLWQEQGHIDTIPAKFEDFTILDEVLTCVFIDPKGLDHPVNRARSYLKKAREQGEARVDEFGIPATMEGEFDGLVPLMLAKGEKLYVASEDASPCAHGWSALHPANEGRSPVVNEVSAIPLTLAQKKPPVTHLLGKGLKPAGGSADMTTDYFKRGLRVYRKPILSGLFAG